MRTEDRVFTVMVGEAADAVVARGGSRSGVGGAELALGLEVLGVRAGGSGGSSSGWNRFGLPGVASLAWRRVIAARGTAARLGAPGLLPPRPGIPEGP